MPRIRLWHGSSEPLEAIDLSKTHDGGFHCGTRAQAEMRARGYLHEVELDILHVKHVRDTGGNWSRKIAEARRREYCALSYLNRYEGIPAERIQSLQESGDLDRLDKVGDAAFRKLVPEAELSYVILHAADARIILTIELARPPVSRKLCENHSSIPDCGALP